MLTRLRGRAHRARPASEEREAALDAAAPPPLVAGDLLAPGYRVVDLLARGSRVDTYDAHSEERDCRVVVKQVRPDRAHEPHVRRALVEEGRLLLACTHPHLLRGYEVVGPDGPDDPDDPDHPPTVVLETLPGTVLSAVVDDGPLAAHDVARLGLQLLSALRYLHRQHDRLHLDLKPDNVVVREGQAVLIDLGASAAPGPCTPGSGTRGYLAPEQARGDLVGPATDVWGLAVTLAECATGHRPHGDEATWDSGPRPRGWRALPTPRLRGVDPALRELVGACLAHDPAARPTTAEVRTGLAALLGR